MRVGEGGGGEAWVRGVPCRASAEGAGGDTKHTKNHAHIVGLKRKRKRGLKVI